jgi:LPXTG-site transpeptidase (sortase) family protein
MIIKGKIKRYLKWYYCPLIYFMLTGLLCAYAWYTRPICHRTGIKAVFKTILLNPTLMLTGAITVWIIIAIITIPISFWLKKKFPELSIFSSSQKEGILQNTSSNTAPPSFWIKTVNVSLSVLGVLLIVIGLSIAIWVSRPYITFLLFPSKIEELEKKAELFGQAQGYRIENSAALQTKAEFSDEAQQNGTKKSGIVEKTADFQERVQGDEREKGTALQISTKHPEQIQRDEIKKSGFLENIMEIRQREITRKADGLEKAAAHIEQGQEDRIIIPTALVDAPILEGIDMEKLSEGVCHRKESSVPGQGGNFIIEGHNLGEFGWWRPQGPFSMLEIMEKGIPIYVFYKGKKYIYKVRKKIYTDIKDPNLFDFSPGERLTLITCTSSPDITVYTKKRTVIVAYPE